MTIGKLIIVTGAPRIVGGVFSKNTQSFEAIPYFSSIYNEFNLDETADARDSFFKELLELENERNSEIENLLQTHSVVVVEEWHLGNTAWAKAKQTPLFDIYREKLERSTREIGKANLIVWFVSTDPEKRSPKSQTQYNLYLEELTDLISHLNLRCDTIDGEDTPSSIEKRVSFLLNSLFKVQ